MRIFTTIAAALALLLSSACAEPKAALADVEPTSWTITEIYWSDADSGRINGERFRLYNIDAPETGGVGAAIGPAQCELERERGFAAKAFMVEQTRDAELKISATNGYDKMPEPRLLIELTVNGEDVAARGIEAGFLKPWPHDGTKALTPKPDWCQ